MEDIKFGGTADLSELHLLNFETILVADGQNSNH